MAKGRKLWESPVVQHRLQVGGHARVCGSISATARTFAHDRKTVRDCLHRYEEFVRTGNLAVFLNRPRGNSHRTATVTEQVVVDYYQEPDTQRTCPNIARAVQESQQVQLSRQTVYNILRRRGVWVPPRHRGPPLTRFQMPQPNELWQADLIELEETCLGKVFAFVALDDHSRFLTALRFFFTKDQEGVLYALFLAFCEYGLPLRILVDRGVQFYASEEGAESRFQEIMSALGIQAEFTSRPETKGKVEKANQFVERDFLNVERNRVANLEELNTKADQWRQTYNARMHEGIQATPLSRYHPSLHRLQAEALWHIFATEQRRKVYRDGTFSLWSRRYPLPKEYVADHAWVRTFHNEIKVVVGPDDEVIATYACPSSSEEV